MAYIRLFLPNAQTSGKFPGSRDSGLLTLAQEIVHNSAEKFIYIYIFIKYFHGAYSVQNKFDIIPMLKASLLFQSLSLGRFLGIIPIVSYSNIDFLS